MLNDRGDVIGVCVGMSAIADAQNLNFAIPSDYVRGMLLASSSQPLASVYEPPATKDDEVVPAAEAPASGVQTAAVPNPSEELRRGSLPYLDSKLFKWKLEDARRELGEPTGTRPSLANGQVTGSIYRFSDPTRSSLGFELTFDNLSTLMTMVIAYPMNVTLDQMKKAFGGDYMVQKQPNGEKLLAYKNRRVMLRIDDRERVISIGTF